MELFTEVPLLTKDKEPVNGDDVLKDKMLGLYFSAGWCLPCQQFTPVLAEAYKEIQARQSKFEVIYLPCDKTEDDMWDYVNKQHADWLVVPFQHDVIETLKKLYGVTMIPKLLIVSGSGELISERGRKDVQGHGMIAFRKWSETARRSQSVTSANDIEKQLETESNTSTVENVIEQHSNTTSSKSVSPTMAAV